jgi:hypothetical protein
VEKERKGGKGLREMKRSAVIKGLQHLEGEYGTV